MTNDGGRIPFGESARELPEIGSQTEAAIHNVITRGQFILGPEVSAFEEEFAQYCGAGGAVAAASGTDALVLALTAVGATDGDEVITTTLTSGATPTAIVRSGARPVLVDVDPVSLNLDPMQVADRVTRRTKAIVPVHLYGCPANLTPLIDLAASRGLVVVEDCAQAHGAHIEKRHVGTLGAAGCFSFYPSKNLGAYGDGGMVIFEDARLRDRLRMLRQYGWRERDLSDVLGFNSRLDELQAAVLRVKLGHLDGWNARRRKIAERYRELLTGIDGLALPAHHEGHVYHLFVVRTANRDRVRERMLARGVSTGVHYPVPIHRQPAFRPLLDSERQFPEADAACAEVISLPIFPQLTDPEVDRVAEALRDALS